jgi:hypothetical protein
VSETLQLPELSAVAGPLEAGPSKSSTVLLASAVPEMVKFPSLSTLPLGKPQVLGA